MENTNLFVYNNYNDFGENSYNYVKGNDIIAYIENIYQVIYWLRLEVIWRPLNVVFTSSGTIVNETELGGAVYIQNIGNNNYKFLSAIPDEYRILSMANFLSNYSTIETIYLPNTINLTNLNRAFENSNIKSCILNTLKVNDLSYAFLNCKNNFNITFTIDSPQGNIKCENMLQDAVFDTFNLIDINKDNENHFNIQILKAGIYVTNDKDNLFTLNFSGNNFRCDNLYLVYPNSSYRIKNINVEYIAMYSNIGAINIEANEVLLDNDKNNIKNDETFTNIKCNTLIIAERAICQITLNIDYVKTIRLYLDDTYINTNMTGSCRNILKTNLTLDNCLNKIEFVGNKNTDWIPYGTFIINEVNNETWNKLGAKIYYAWKDNTYTKFADIKLQNIEIEDFGVYDIPIDNIEIKGKINRFLQYNTIGTYHTNYKITTTDDVNYTEFNINLNNIGIDSLFSGYFELKSNDLTPRTIKYFKNAVINTSNNITTEVHYGYHDYEFIINYISNEDNNIRIFNNNDGVCFTTIETSENYTIYDLDISHFANNDNKIILRKCKFIKTDIYFDRILSIFIRPINSKFNYQIICINCDNIMCFTDLTSENKPLYLKGSNYFTYSKGSNHVSSDKVETAHKFNDTANFYNNDTIYLDGDENAYLYLDGKTSYSGGTYSKIKTIISKNIIISFRTNISWHTGNSNYVYAVGIEELTNITCDRSFINCYIDCYTKLTSDSINNLISHLIDNTDSNIASIGLTRAQYNLLTDDNVQNALNLNYEFNIIN